MNKKKRRENVTPKQLSIVVPEVAICTGVWLIEWTCIFVAGLVLFQETLPRRCAWKKEREGGGGEYSNIYR